MPGYAPWVRSDTHRYPAHNGTSTFRAVCRLHPMCKHILADSQLGNFVGCSTAHAHTTQQVWHSCNSDVYCSGSVLRAGSPLQTLHLLNAFLLLVYYREHFKFSGALREPCPYMQPCRNVPLSAQLAKPLTTTVLSTSRPVTHVLLDCRC